MTIFPLPEEGARYMEKGTGKLVEVTNSGQMGIVVFRPVNGENLLEPEYWSTDTFTRDWERLPLRRES